MIFDDMLTLDDIKKEPFVIEHILWEIGPKQLLEPKSKPTEDGIKYADPIKGYVFYIETMGEKKSLLLMRHTANGYAESAGQIDEIPEELLQGALEENKDRIEFGMCPINKKIEDWLRKELGIR